MPSRPQGGGASTSQGHPQTILRRALERGNLLVAEATARELQRVSLPDALELTILIAQKEPRRHPRVAARWLLRFLAECAEATIEEASMVTGCLVGLVGDHHEEAAATLRVAANRASMQRGHKRKCERRVGSSAAFSRRSARGPVPG